MATSKATQRKRAGIHIAGEKGKNRVRAYPDSRSGKYFLEFYEDGKRQRLSLGHTDFAQGQRKAEELAAELSRGEGAPVGELTLKTLFDNYRREVSPQYGPSKQGHDELASALFLACWGNAKVNNLDRKDWDRFIQQRRNGALRPERERRKRRGVGDRVIEFDLKFLLAACSWATTVRHNGKPMLERNPFKGFPIPVETSPRRPTVTDAELAKLRNAAARLGPRVELYLLLAQETGHRCSAVGHLRWNDIDLENGWVTWQKESDKTGYRHRTPLHREMVEALKTERKKAARIGDGWVFPSPDDPEKPISRNVLAQDWYRLERAAGLARIPGRGWHSLRRKFATDLKTMPLSDLCALGGWKEPTTVLRCYMQADEKTMREAVEKRAERMAAGQ